MDRILTACTYDCPDACGLVAERSGESVILRGNPAHPITRGFSCPRLRRHLARLRDPRRILRPRLRQGERFLEISWGEALDRTAEALAQAMRQHGPAAVVYLSGGGSLGIGKELVGHFFRSLGPITTLRGGMCGEAGEAAQLQDFGDAACHDLTDLACARAVVLWGKNAAATGPHLIPFLRQARARGATVVLVEVRPTETDPFVDRVIRVKAGADGFLALAVLRRLAERQELDPAAMARCENFGSFSSMLCTRSPADWAAAAGVAPGEVEALAGLYRSSKPVATLLGWGLQRRMSGGKNVRCLDALGMLTGNIGVPGGGVGFTSTRRRGLDLALLAPATGRTLAAPTLARDLAGLRDPPARFVYLCGANPATQAAAAGAVRLSLRGCGFTVVADAFFTDTAGAADLILPSCLMLEEDDLVGSYSHHHLAEVHLVLAPPGEARPDVWIVRELRRRLALPADPLLEDPQAALRRLAARWFAGMRGGFGRNPAQPPVPFADRFPTPSGKMRLIEQPPEAVPAKDGFPLLLLTPSARSWQASQWAEECQDWPLECRVHPTASGVGGRQDGARAVLASPTGKLTVRLRLDPTLPEDLCQVQPGGWARLGCAINDLIGAQATDLGEGTAYYDQRVRLEP